MNAGDSTLVRGRQLAAPARQQSVRRHNLGLVLRHLGAAGPSTRARIAGATGLTKGTVSSLVAELIEGGLVAEPGQHARGELGRPGSVLEVAAGGGAGLGLEVNVDYMAVCVTDLAQTIRFHRVDCVDNRASPEKALRRVAHLARAGFTAAASQGLTVSGIGVAVPGVVDPGEGLLHHAPNLGWRELPLADLLAEQLAEQLAQQLEADLPLSASDLHIDNEANLAALAELWFGGGSSWGDYLHVSGEIGVGAALVTGGRLFRGSRGFAGEVGHVSLNADGPVCTCGGRGCLERYCGQESILRAAGLDLAPTTSTGQPDGSLANLLEALRAGHPRALQAVRDAGSALGLGVAGVVNVVDVDTVVLGGIFSPLAPWLVEPFTESLQRQAIAVGGASVRVQVSALGPDAAVRGAAGLVTQEILTDPGAVTAPR